MAKPNIDVNGVIRPMTDEEYARYCADIKNFLAFEPSPEERRLDEIEAALIELAAMIAGGGD